VRSIPILHDETLAEHIPVLFTVEVGIKIGGRGSEMGLARVNLLVILLE
jgi:hypothetical protein